MVCMPAKILPPTRELLRKVEAGWTHREIADWIFRSTGEKVTRASVSVALHRAGYCEINHRYSDCVPWRVKEVHSMEYPARMLRLLGRSMKGCEISHIERKRLERWLKELREINHIVAYVPDSIPAFHYVEATEDKDKPNGIPVRPRIMTAKELKKLKIIPK